MTMVRSLFFGIAFILFPLSAEAQSNSELQRQINILIGELQELENRRMVSILRGTIVLNSYQRSGVTNLQAWFYPLDISFSDLEESLRNNSNNDGNRPNGGIKLVSRRDGSFNYVVDLPLPQIIIRRESLDPSRIFCALTGVGGALDGFGEFAILQQRGDKYVLMGKQNGSGSTGVGVECLAYFSPNI